MINIKSILGLTVFGLALYICFGFFVTNDANSTGNGNPNVSSCESRLLVNADECSSYVVGFECSGVEQTGDDDDEISDTQCFEINSGITTNFESAPPGFAEGTCSCLANNGQFQTSADFLCRADSANWVQYWNIAGSGNSMRGQGFYGTSGNAFASISDCVWTQDAQDDCYEKICD